MCTSVMPPTRGSSPAFEAAEQERSRQLLEAAGTEAGIDARLAWIGSPSVGRGLHELAERRGADLLVVGWTSRGLLGRVLIGDDTRDALNGAPCRLRSLLRDIPSVRCTGARLGSATTAHRRASTRSRWRASSRESSVRRCRLLRRSRFPLNPRGLGEAIDQLVNEARDRIASAGQRRTARRMWCGGRGTRVVRCLCRPADRRIARIRPIGRLVHGSTSQRLARHSALSAGRPPPRDAELWRSSNAQAEHETAAHATT